jgi:arylsulfatase A-like enzyme
MPVARARLVLSVALLCGCGGESGGEGRPPVILVSIDTLRADHVGLYGYERDTTPFLDRWSAGATVYERAFTTAAWTLVAHMTMLTGLFPEQHDVTGKRRALAPEIPLLAERLRAAGYATIGLHAPGWMDARYGFGRGFDVYREHGSLEEADRNLRAELDALDGRAPLFLFLHLFDVHCGPFARSVRSIYPAPAPYELMFVAPDAPPVPDRPAEELWSSQGWWGPRELEAVVATYDGGIRETDDRLAVWFTELERRGLLEGALVIVTSDHGEALGQRGRLDRHGEYWHEGLHVPLIVRHPGGLLAGERVREAVHLGDVVPTVLAACGLPPDARLPGRSLFDPLPAERVIYGIKLPEAFVLRWPEKIVAGPKDWCIATDLERDPRELAPGPGNRERFQELRREALGSSTFPRALRLEELTPAEQAELDALGYGGDATEDGHATGGASRAGGSADGTRPR